MRRKLGNLTPILWAAAVALLVVRTAEAHVHLCLDGQEPPRSLHVLDVGVKCHTAGETENDNHSKDVDVAVTGAAVAKKDAQDATIVPPLFAPVLLALIPPPQDTPSAWPTVSVRPANNRPYLHRPQLRGPPR